MVVSRKTDDYHYDLLAWSNNFHAPHVYFLTMWDIVLLVSLSVLTCILNPLIGSHSDCMCDKWDDIQYMDLEECKRIFRVKEVFDKLYLVF